MSETSMIIKLDCKGMIKRVREVPQTFTQLLALVAENYPDLPVPSVAVQYIDAEGDHITVSSDSDLKEAYFQLRDAQQSCLKFFISEAGPGPAAGFKDERASCTSSGRPAGSSGFPDSQPVPPSEDPSELPNQKPKETSEKKKKKKKKQKQKDKGKKERSKLEQALADKDSVLKTLVKDIAKAELAKCREEIQQRAAQEIASAMEASNAGAPIVHTNVECDGCKMAPIIGCRFKCAVCSDYDLCEACEAKGVHKEHAFLKIKSPEYFRAMAESNSQGRGFANPPSKQEEESKQKPFASTQEQEFDIPRPRCFKRMIQVAGDTASKTVEVTCEPAYIFCARWRLQNNSKKPWPSPLFLLKCGGDVEFETTQLENALQPTATMDLELPITAPKTLGKHYLQLLFQDEAGQEIGQRLNVNLTVNVARMTVQPTDEIYYKALELEEQHLGSFDACYAALVTARGNIEVAKHNLTIH